VVEGKINKQKFEKDMDSKKKIFYELPFQKTYIFKSSATLPHGNFIHATRKLQKILFLAQILK